MDWVAGRGRLASVLFTGTLGLSACGKTSLSEPGGTASEGTSGAGGSGATGGVSTGGVAGTGEEADGSGAGPSPNGASGGGGGSGGSGGADAPAPPCEAPPLAAGSSGDPFGEVCVGVGHEVERLGVELYLLVNAGVSMVGPLNDPEGSPWQVAVQGITEFLSNAPPDLSVGLGLYGMQDQTCEVDAIETPVVPFAPLPEAAEEISAALLEAQPSGESSGYLALRAAVEFVRQRRLTAPQTEVVLVLLSDSLLPICDELDDLWSSEVFSTLDRAPPIGLEAIGIGTLDGFDALRDATLVRLGLSASAGLASTLLGIANEATHCHIPLPEPPDGQGVDYDQVALLYEGAEGEVLVPYLPEGESGCLESLEGGWYFGGADLNGNFTHIETCPCTCSAMLDSAAEVRLGCSAGFP